MKKRRKLITIKTGNAVLLEREMHFSMNADPFSRTPVTAAIAEEIAKLSPFFFGSLETYTITIEERPVE